MLNTYTYNIYDCFVTNLVGCKEGLNPSEISGIVLSGSTLRLQSSETSNESINLQ